MMFYIVHKCLGKSVNKIWIYVFSIFIIESFMDAHFPHYMYIFNHEFYVCLVLLFFQKVKNSFTFSHFR